MAGLRSWVLHSKVSRRHRETRVLGELRNFQAYTPRIRVHTISRGSGRKNGARTQFGLRERTRAEYRRALRLARSVLARLAYNIGLASGGREIDPTRTSPDEIRYAYRRRGTRGDRQFADGLPRAYCKRRPQESRVLIFRVDTRV